MASSRGWSPDPDALHSSVAVVAGSVTVGQLAAEYGFTDLDGTRPDSRRQHDSE